MLTAYLGLLAYSAIIAGVIRLAAADLDELDEFELNSDTIAALTADERGE